MKRYLYIYIVLFAVLISSCNNYEEYEAPSRNDMAEVEQVTVMYFLGTSLWYWFDYYNLPAVRSAVADGALGRGGRLFVLRSSSFYKSELYEIYADNGGYKTQSVKSYSDSASKLTSTTERMAEVIEEVQSYASAKSYNLIVSGHGTGWVLQSHPYVKSTLDYVDWEQMGSGDVVTKFMGSSTDGYMEITELREALESTNTKYGYILFDMCLMSNIETLYELKGVCDNVISSPTEVMGDGFPYDTVLPELFANSGSSVDYEGACEAYYNYYKEHYKDPYGTVAWCVTSELGALAESVKAINESGTNVVSTSELQYYEALTSHVFYDLRDYVSAATDDAVLYGAFEDIFDKAFPEEGRYHTDTFISTLLTSNGTVIPIDSYSGVSTSEPSTKFTDEWAETSWAQATQVDEAD